MLLPVCVSKVEVLSLAKNAYFEHLSHFPNTIKREIVVVTLHKAKCLAMQPQFMSKLISFIYNCCVLVCFTR